MAQNQNIGKLDAGQIPMRIFDAENDAYRVTFVGGQIQIALDSSEDSVVAHSSVETLTFAPVALSSSTPINCEKYAAYKIYAASNLSDVVVEVSPLDTGDVWFPVAAEGSLVAKRARIRSTSVGANGVTYYLVVRS
jgi:hypothetical protein